MTEGNGKVTLTVRLIRSFEHKNWKPIVLHNVDLVSTTEEFVSIIKSHLSSPTTKVPPPFKTFNYDTLKVEYQPFGFKTNDPLINQTEDDKLILRNGLTLEAQNIRNETEISFFKWEDYTIYKTKPTA